MDLCKVFDCIIHKIALAWLKANKFHNNSVVSCLPATLLTNLNVAKQITFSVSDKKYVRCYSRTITI